MEVHESVKWGEFGALGKTGSENGVIIADWEWPGVGRVTVERGWHSALLHHHGRLRPVRPHRVCGTRVEATEKARVVMAGVELLMRSLDEDGDYDVGAWCERLAATY